MKHHTLLGWNNVRAHLVHYTTVQGDDVDLAFVDALALLRRQLGHARDDPRWAHLDGKAAVGSTYDRRKGQRCENCRALTSRRLCGRCNTSSRRARKREAVAR